MVPYSLPGLNLMAEFNIVLPILRVCCTVFREFLLDLQFILSSFF